MIKSALIALALLVAPAEAFAQSLSADSTSIAAGQLITYTVVIPASLRPIAMSDCDLCYRQNYEETIVFFHSGDGQFIGDSGPNFLTATFTYPTPGDYIATASGAGFWNTYQCYRGSCQSMPNGSEEFAFDLTLPIHVAGVPEPATWALLLFGFAILALRKTRAVKPQ